MAKSVKVPETVYQMSDDLADERDMSKKEAIRFMCRKGGFDV